MRNPLHAICPYFAMFPEAFVQKNLLAYSRPDDLVFDPFCGRGTTILESLLNKRSAIGSDINPVAACIAGAKANIPTKEEVFDRLEALRSRFPEAGVEVLDSEFFETCFSPSTLQQVLFLRRELNWRGDHVDRFIAALTLGVLHGESHRTELCLSNRMPRTISTKPDYSVRWWNERGLRPPDRDAFEVLRRIAEFRLKGAVPEKRGEVILGDSRQAGQVLSRFHGRVSLVVTSPPYLDTTDYAEDQWLRLWFLGGEERPRPRLHKDDRHTKVDDYWAFLAEIWKGCADLLAAQAHVVVRIGGTKLDKEQLFEGLLISLLNGTGKNVTALHNGETSQIKRRQTNSFRPGTSPDKLEHDFAFRVET